MDHFLLQCQTRQVNERIVAFQHFGGDPHVGQQFFNVFAIQQMPQKHLITSQGFSERKKLQGIVQLQSQTQNLIPV